MKWPLRILAGFIAFSGVLLLVVAITSLHKGESESDALFFSSAMSGIFACLLWHWSGADDRANRTNKNKRDSIERETMAFFEAVNATGVFPPASTARIISRPENPVLAVCNARLLEVSTAQVRQYLGTRIQVAGLPIYLGQSTSTAQRKLTEAAVGELALTPKSIIFNGSQRSTDVDFNQITALDIALDGITVSVKGRQKPYIFIVPNGFLWGMLVKNLTQIEVTGRSLPTGIQLQIL